MVFPLSSSEIFIGTPQKELFYLDVGIANIVFCKTSTFFGIKSKKLFVKVQQAQMLQFHYAWQNKFCALCKPNKLYTIGNIISLAKMLFSYRLSYYHIIIY